MKPSDQHGLSAPAERQLQCDVRTHTGLRMSLRDASAV